VRNGEREREGGGRMEEIWVEQRDGRRESVDVRRKDGRRDKEEELF
jgi:hypothetical protein